ncbi:MAG TPA: ubiquitin-like domain-containing protein [Actinocrinis sp.]|uniref:ubiquitin-like domain-containing protein n=1 Tax=Actinocrinis sp. TaxID=1920516 RepID=UPI002DDCE0C1|nr:ubiquitin-like domain-containing protein [Actinocrinis sp.]HEV2343322.1 ubiquitin-like domain-containing protein [Actinocrinis sp.]
MSGSRSTRDTGGGGPIQGASAWPSSFTGPARYSPPFNSDATEDPSAYGEAYAPYAGAGSDYVDPYAAEAYADPYATESYSTEPYGAEAYAPESYGAETYSAEPYAAAPYEGDPYGYAAADYAKPEFASSAYLDESYPAHEFENFNSTGYANAPGYDVDVAETPPVEPPAIPGQREPESPRGRAAQRHPAPRRKVGWAGRTVQGVVLASLLGGVTVYVAFEKTVNVSVDGSVRQIHSFASTVGAALASDDITTGSHDLVSPVTSTTLADNSTITVKYGRPVNITVNGTAEHAWVHSPTVGAALQELGVRIQGARFMSVNADTPIGRSGAAFSVFTLRHVTFLVDGKTDQLDTTDATVQQALNDAGIAMHNQDTASVPMNAIPTDGETISIMRITGTTEVKQVSIPYTVTKESDPSSYLGSTTVVTSGQDGVAQVTYALQIINGVKQSPKEISRTVIKQPVAEVDKVGAKALPTNVSSLNWAALAQCESGGNPQSVDASGTYYGLYQFSVSTWDSLGGSGLPSQASAAEQTSLAELLYQRDGAGQWPVCGHNLFS